jgi:hypothetical protein
MMAVYFYARINRGDFGDLISEEGVSRLRIEQDANPVEALDNNAIVAVWSLDPKKTTQLPEVLICRDGTQSDWAAWISTFATRIRPFSAYSRLMTNTEFQRVMRKPPTPGLGPLTWPVAGLVLGDVLGASGLPDKALETLSATVLSSTLSFVMWRTAAIYPDFQDWQRLVEVWQSVLQMTNQRHRPVESGMIARVCGTIMSAAGYQGASKILTRDDSEASEACRSFIASPNRVPINLTENRLLENADTIMRGSREDRVVAFEDFIRKSDDIQATRAETRSFIIGYLASRIAPGMIRHSSVLEKVVSRFPTAMLWYGFCSGFPESDMGGSEPNLKRTMDLPASARRAVRELLRPEPALGTPACDIAYPELVALSRTGGNVLDGVIRATPGSLIVELLPGVSTSVNAVTSQPAKPPVIELREREIVASLGEQIERLGRTFRSLREMEESREPQQGFLFPPRRKKR